MDLFLEILSGNLKGIRIPVRAGVLLGRKFSGLSIQDPKISVKHARIDLSADGLFALVDLDSENGILLPNGALTKTLVLSPGVNFTLGETSFGVISNQIRDQEDEAPGMPPEMTITRNFWDRLKALARSGARKNSNKKVEVQPISPVLHLKFIRGVQFGTHWTLGYGPRQAGTNDSDLHLIDPEVEGQKKDGSGIYFRLLPVGSKVVIKSEEQNKVRLNGVLFTEQDLHAGDIIDVGFAAIEVSYK